MRRHIRAVGIGVVASAATFLACNDESILSPPSDGSSPPRPSRLTPVDPAVQRPASDGLRPSFYFLVAPGDTTTDPCFGGEYCGVQGRPAGGMAEIYCPNGPGTCPSQQFRWSIQNPPPNTTTTFDPEVTVTDQTTTFLIHTDSTTVPGTYRPVIVSTLVSNNTVYTTDTIPVRIRCNIHFKTCPQIEIVDRAQADTPTVSRPSPGPVAPAESTLIGRHVRLEVRWKQGSGTPGTGSYTLSQPRWSIPGNKVKSYDIQSGMLMPFDTTALRATLVPYYWVQGNNGYTVYVVATLTRSDNQQVSFPEAIAVYHVQAPTNVKLTTKTTAVFVGPYAAPQDFTLQALSFGNEYTPMPGNGYGIEFTFTANALAGGRMAGTQLIRTGSQYSPVPSDPEHVFTSTNGQYWLDNCPLYRTGSVFGPTGVYEWVDRDAPGGYLFADFNRLVRADAFKTYFMYRPEPGQADSVIWVPIGLLEWSWSGAAIRGATSPADTSNVWGPDLSPPPSWSPGPTGQLSAEFPQWPITLINDPRIPPSCQSPNS